MADADAGSIRKAFCWSLQWKGHCSLPGVKQAASSNAAGATLQHEQIHLVTSDRWITFLEELQRCAEGGGGGGGVQAPFLWDCPTASWQARPGQVWQDENEKRTNNAQKKRAKSDGVCEIRTIRVKEYQAEKQMKSYAAVTGDTLLVVVGSGFEVTSGDVGVLFCCSFFSACSLSRCRRRYAALCWISSCWDVDSSWNQIKAQPKMLN